MKKLGPDTPNHELGHMKSNSKPPIPRFTSKEALLHWQIHLRIEFDLFHVILGINSKFSFPYFTSNEAILKGQDHLRVELIPVWESASCNNM